LSSDLQPRSLDNSPFIYRGAAMLHSDHNSLLLQWRVAELLARRCQSFSSGESTTDTRAWWAGVEAIPGEQPHGAAGAPAPGQRLRPARRGIEAPQA